MSQAISIAIKSFASTVYFAIAIVALIVLGGHFSQAMAIAAAFFAGISQLILQGHDDKAQTWGTTFIFAAMMTFIAGWFSFAWLL